MKREVTLDEVARRSGVSRATASRALNNREGVRADVRERVRLIAEALDYRPNRAARNLAGAPASVLGLVVRDRQIVPWPYLTALIEAVARAADKRGQALVLIMSANRPNQTVRETVRDGLVDGLILTIGATSSEWAEETVKSAVPAVIIGGTRPGFSVPSVDAENKNSSATIVGHMLDTGCERLATITGPLDRDDAVGRLEGYRLAHRRRSIEVDESLIFKGDYDRSTGYDLAPQIFEKEVDGVFCANDEVARGVYRRAMECGMAVPEDLSLAGFDGTSIDPYEFVRLTSVVQPLMEMADGAVDLLLKRIADDSVVETRVFESEVFFGATTRPKRQ